MKKSKRTAASTRTCLPKQKKNRKMKTLIIINHSFKCSLSVSVTKNRIGGKGGREEGGGDALFSIRFRDFNLVAHLSMCYAKKRAIFFPH